MAKSKRAQRPPTRNGTTTRSTTAVNAPATAKARAANGAPAASRNGGNGTAGGRATSSAARSIAARAATPSKSRRRQQPSGWRRMISGQGGIWIALVSVALVVTLFVIIAHNNSGTSTRQPVSKTLLNQVTQVSQGDFAKVGTGGISDPFKATPAGTTLLTSGGKPQLLYVGAEYCPHCAAERWAMVVALSRFGTFSNLRLIKSISTDTPANVPTFTFYQSTYSSPYLTFTPVEIQDGVGNNLETLSTEQNQIFTKYDAAPYTTTAGAIPFVDVGNQYIQIGEGFPSTLIATDTWQSIGNSLGNLSTPEAQNVLGSANYLTAAICKITNDKPANVCTAAPIPTIEQQLPKGQ